MLNNTYAIFLQSETQHAQPLQQIDKLKMLKENTRLCPDETNPMEFRQV